jgi:hypothetical protein
MLWGTQTAGVCVVCVCVCVLPQYTLMHTSPMLRTHTHTHSGRDSGGKDAHVEFLHLLADMGQSNYLTGVWVHICVYVSVY